MIPVFIDTETTGVHRGYRAWEIALIRRTAAGAEAEITIFVDVDDLALESADPAALAVGRFEERHPQKGGSLGDNQVLLTGSEAAQEVLRWTAGAEIFGINPGFDVTAVDELLSRHHLEGRWFYCPVDLLGVAYGYLLGRGVACPPRSSECLSIACGVTPPVRAERHTAMGDARWVARWYDHLGVGGPRVGAA